MLLTIDIGNTNTVLGVFDGDQVIEHWRIATVPDRTADELAVVLHGLLAGSSAFTERDINGISLCSTVPSVLHEMREMCAALLRRPGHGHRRAGVRPACRCGPTTRRKWAATGS